MSTCTDNRSVTSSDQCNAPDDECLQSVSVTHRLGDNRQVVGVTSVVCKPDGMRLLRAPGSVWPVHRRAGNESKVCRNFEGGIVPDVGGGRVRRLMFKVDGALL